MAPNCSERILGLQKKLCSLIFIRVDTEQGKGDRKKEKNRKLWCQFSLFPTLYLALQFPSTQFPSSCRNRPTQVPESSADTWDPIGPDCSPSLNIWLHASMMEGDLNLCSPQQRRGSWNKGGETLMIIILPLSGRSLVRGRYGPRVIIWTGLQSQLHDDPKILIMSSSYHHHCSHRTKLYLGLKGCPGSRQWFPALCSLLTSCLTIPIIWKVSRMCDLNLSHIKEDYFFFICFHVVVSVYSFLTLKSVMNVLFCFPWSSILQAKLSQFQYHRII